MPPCRYAEACSATAGTAPDFIYPHTAPTAAAPDARLRVTLASRAAAITSMRQSIIACLSPQRSPNAPKANGAPPTLPPLQHADELAAAVKQHKDFFYQVSLPHYRDPAFIDGAVARCATPVRPCMHPCQTQCSHPPAAFAQACSRLGAFTRWDA